MAAPLTTTHTPEEIERGLQALARLGSSAKAAAETGLNGRTLRSWRHLHAERYQEIHEEVLPQIQKAMAQESELLTREHADLELEMLTYLRDKASQLEAKDLAGAIRNIATSRGISTDKAMVLRGMPTQIIEQRAPDQILKQLAQRYGQVIEGSAVEISEQLPSPERIATTTDGRQ